MSALDIYYMNSNKMLSQAQSSRDDLLTQDTISQSLYRALEKRYSEQKVLIIIPDHTRSLPIADLFPTLVDVLHDAVKLDFLVALGTHPPLSQAQLHNLVGISDAERDSKFQHVGIFNHSWDSPDNLIKIGILSKYEIREFAGDSWHPTLGDDIAIEINRIIFDYDHILILGPTSPHEVAGFSGGAKYLFPGIAGPDIIDAIHWMGALIGVRSTIGHKYTPVQKLINAAAESVHIPITLIAVVVVNDHLVGMFIGGLREAWSAATDLSAQRHIKWFDQPFRKVLSAARSMYDELWTGAKAFYKVEPVVADGGEVIIYAPHLKVISQSHGKYIYQTGYHVMDYFLKQWESFEQFPLGVLAHSTHLRGEGTYEDGIEKPRVKVTLASQISHEVCQSLGLGYMHPDQIDFELWQNREEEGCLFVPKAGEILYKLRQS